ncbi:MAG: hypothetical protein IJL47_04895 [Lachnospiraceae bacterium]|nr:hypothetical protein [Lachnospiraceae bacterium]
MAYISIIILVITIIVSYFSGINAGIVGISFAYLFGRFCVGLSVKEIVAGFPVSTAFALMGMTFLFGIARENGTLTNIAHTIIRLARGKTIRIPFLFFLLGAILSGIGPGPVVICALIAPIAMATAKVQKIPDIIMAITVWGGSISGGLSGISTSGIIAKTLGREQGVENYTPIFLSCMIITFVLFILFFVLFGGLKLMDNQVTAQNSQNITYDKNQKITLVVILLTIILISVFGLDTGLTAFLGGLVLLFLKAVDQNAAIKCIAWPTILLISGMGILINVVNLSGGISEITRLLSKAMTETTATPLICVIAGLMSSVSSASGVVMPTLIPTISELSEALGSGVSASSLLAGIVVGSHVVTASPLSTTGAICLSAANEQTDKQKLFTQMIIIGFSSIVIAAIVGGLGLFYL